jgi:two-component system LytT family response regulator
MRILIVDDEASARARLKALLESEPDAEVVGECADGHEAVEAIRWLAPDLVFLDVQMPEMDGIGVVRAIGPADFPLVVFVTAFDRYAVEAFDLNASDYLLKPYTEERFRRTLERSRETLRRRDLDRLNDGLSDLLDRFRAGNGYLRRLVVRLEGRVKFVDVEDVDWIEADAKIVRLHAGGAVYPLRESIGRLEERLDPSRFLRIHRSVIVQVARVTEIETSSDGKQRVLLRDGARLPLSRGNRLKVYDIAAEEPALRSR